MKIIQTIGIFAIEILGVWAILPSDQESSTDIANIEDFMPAIMREAEIAGMAVTQFDLQPFMNCSSIAVAFLNPGLRRMSARPPRQIKHLYSWFTARTSLFGFSGCWKILPQQPVINATNFVDLAENYQYNLAFERQGQDKILRKASYIENGSVVPSTMTLVHK